jgi:hypothetical protein
MLAEMEVMHGSKSMDFSLPSWSSQCYCWANTRDQYESLKLSHSCKRMYKISWVTNNHCSGLYLVVSSKPILLPHFAIVELDFT